MAHPLLEEFEQTGEMGILMSTHDWSKTPFGDPSTWPEGLFSLIGVMLENKIAMCILWGPDFLQLYNDAYVPILGNKHPAAFAQPMYVSWPEVAESARSITDDVLKGKSVHFRNKKYTVNVGAHPEEHFYTYSCVPIRVRPGAVSGVLMTSIEVTQEIVREGALKESERIFRAYQEQSPLPFLSMNKDLVVDYINPAGIRHMVVTGQTVEVVGKSFFELWPATRGTIFEESTMRAMKGEVVEYEARYEPLDRWFRILVYPQLDGLGVYYQDISVNKELQLSLEHAVRARDQFLSLASHELNTPLTSLKLNTQMMERSLESGKLDHDRLKKFFQQTEFHISRLGQLVGDMMDSSRVREGRFNLKLETLDLSQLVADSLERYAPQFIVSGVRAPVINRKGKNFQIKGDRERLDQVMCNLFSNAIKYGKGNPVSVTIEEEAQEVRVSVKDQGIGVPPGEEDSIFEQYHRSSSAVGEGLGLGLYIAREILRALGGRISVESEQEKGSTFSLWLPKVLVGQSDK